MNLNIIEVHPERLVPHPRNRKFKTTGPEWEQFEESIGFRGVVSAIIVRPLGNGHDWQIIAGHRRTYAARKRGLPTVPIQVEDFTDAEAMEMVFIDNLLAAELDPIDEAEGVAGLLEVGYSLEKIAKRCCRDPRWVKTRQGLLELGDEAVRALRLPKEDPRCLQVRVAEAVLDVVERAPELKDEALQLVLHPEFQVETLRAHQVKDVLTTQLLGPHLKRIEWEEGRERLVKEWRKRLTKSLKEWRKGLPKERVKAGEFDGELTVIGVPWGDCEMYRKGGVSALKPVPMAEQSADAPQFLAWLHLAVRHGMPVRLVNDPDGGQEKCLVLVDQRVLQQAEESGSEMRQYDGEGKRLAEAVPVNPDFKPWLVTRARGTVSKTAGTGKAAGGEGEGLSECPGCKEEFERLGWSARSRRYLCFDCIDKEVAAGVAKEIVDEVKAVEDEMGRGRVLPDWIACAGCDKDFDVLKPEGISRLMKVGDRRAIMCVACAEERSGEVLEKALRERVQAGSRCIVCLKMEARVEELRCDECQAAFEEDMAAQEAREKAGTGVTDPVLIDMLPVRGLSVSTFAPGWEKSKKTPEWAKDLEPQHVRDVLDWVMGLEITVALEGGEG